MTPEVQQNKLFSGNVVVVLDTKKMQQSNISFDVILACWDRGILLTEDVYRVYDKDIALKELIDNKKL